MAEVRTGKLKERVNIYELTDGVDEYGSTITQRVLYWETWADVKPIRGRKYLEAQQEVMKDSFKITVRYRADKNPNKRLQMDYRGKVLNLTSIINDEVDKLYVEWWGNYES